MSNLANGKVILKFIFFFFLVQKRFCSLYSNSKNNFLVLGKRPTEDNKGSVGLTKNVSINFNKGSIKFS